MVQLLQHQGHQVTPSTAPSTYHGDPGRHQRGPAARARLPSSSPCPDLQNQK